MPFNILLYDKIQPKKVSNDCQHYYRGNIYNVILKMIFNTIIQTANNIYGRKRQFENWNLKEKNKLSLTVRLQS